MKHSFENLSKRLGALDKERREILDLLKKSPENCMRLLKQLLDGFVATNSKSWFSRENDKGQSSYFQLVSYEITPTTNRSIRSGKQLASTPATSLTKTKHNSMLAKVKLIWTVYAYDATKKLEQTEFIDISIFNDIEKQILNGRKRSTTFDEKSLVKAALKVKQKALEDQLKAVKGEIAAIK